MQLSRSIRFTLVFLLLTGLIYPMAVTGAAKLLFPWQAAGSQLQQNGQPVGSALIGQAFTKPEFFQGRLSSIAYDASSSGTPNFGPSDEALIKRVQDDVAAFKEANPGAPIPSDLLTNSGSGLDPDITPQAAMVQVARVAKARGISEALLTQLVQANTVQPALGFFGEARVNVLKLNLALQGLK
jgi:potassium-transporting ATPase KdpC subunit